MSWKQPRFYGRPKPAVGESAWSWVKEVCDVRAKKRVPCRERNDRSKEGLRAVPQPLPDVLQP